MIAASIVIGGEPCLVLAVSGDVQPSLFESGPRLSAYGHKDGDLDTLMVACNKH